jgi:hypothetical protein
MAIKRTILDAREVERVVPPPAVPLWLDRRPAAQRWVSAMRAEFHGARCGMKLRLVLSIVGGAVFAYLLFRAALTHLGPQDRLWSAIICGIAGIAAGWAFFRLGTKEPNVYKVAYMMAECRLCLCCGYDLGALSPEEDGATVCPECGAAWQIGEKRAEPDAADTIV